MIFKLATSSSLMSLRFPNNLRLQEQLRMLVMGLAEIDMIFKVASLDEVLIMLVL